MESAGFLHSEEYHVLNIQLYEIINSHGRELPQAQAEKHDVLRLQKNEGNDFRMHNTSMDVFIFPSSSQSGDSTVCNTEIVCDENNGNSAPVAFVIFNSTDRYPTSTQGIYCLLHRLLSSINVSSLKWQSIILYIPSYLMEPLNRFRVNNVCGEYGFHFFNFTPATESFNDIFDNNENLLSHMIAIEHPAILTLTRYQTRLTLNEGLSIVDKNGCYKQPFLEQLEDGLTSTDIQIRKVAPRYFEYEKYYPELKLLLEPSNLAIITSEARISSERWIDWPETTHYNSGAEGERWTVFPFCHTFPATDSSATKFINLTCEQCPGTVQLLQSSSIRPKLKTALFSRLGPRTSLGLHTGWEDLANHVLRVHIPLTLPEYEDISLCGTWVEGSIQHHKAGEIIVFDDSKVHRAFNYSDKKERLVLILDMERPSKDKHDIPMGTSVGGHTDELDAFINSI